MRIPAMAFCALLSAAGAARAELDRDWLYKHIRKSFNVPQGLELELKDLKPAAIPGFMAGVLETRYQGRSQTRSIHVTEDGKYYVLSEAFELKPSNLPGLLSPSSQEGGAPQIHVSKDAKHFLVGEPHDLSVDPDAVNLSKLRLTGVPARGPAKAPVAFVEFSDLQCPFCKSAHQALEGRLLTAYGDKVRWVFKHFPLTGIHPWAYNAAIAAACAARLKPEAGWKLESGFFEEQGSVNPGNLREKSLELAKKAGLDPAKFQACYDRQESKEAVEADVEEAKALQVDSTPTFFINGRKVAGFKDFDSIKAIVDEMLAEAASKKN